MSHNHTMIVSHQIEVIVAMIMQPSATIAWGSDHDHTLIVGHDRHDHQISVVRSCRDLAIVKFPPSDLHRCVEVSPHCCSSMHQLLDASRPSDKDRSIEVSRDAAPQCINSAMDHGCSMKIEVSSRSHVSPR